MGDRRQDGGDAGDDIDQRAFGSMLIYRRDVQPPESDPAAHRRSIQFDCTPKNMALPPRGSTNLIPSRARPHGTAESRVTVAVLRVGSLRPRGHRDHQTIRPRQGVRRGLAQCLVERPSRGWDRTVASQRTANASPTPYPRHYTAACLLWRGARHPATRRVQIESKCSRDASAQPARGYRRRRPRAAV
jgi:hypothetical protein